MSKLRTFAIIFGLVFIALAVLAYVPGLNPEGKLLGIFHVNHAHNIIHFLSGAAALICGFYNTEASQQYFRIFGVIYGVVAILGFIYGDRPILGLIANNMADTWLHVAICIASLYLGFVLGEE